MTSVGIIDADSILYILCYSNKDIETFDNLVTMIDNYCYMKIQSTADTYSMNPQNQSHML